MTGVQTCALPILDDGSTDGTGQLCDELALTDGRIKVFHKENGGSSSARNLGISHAKGEYLGFVDSDDYINSTMYEQLYAALTENGVKLAQIGRDEVDENGNLLANICEPPQEIECIDSENFLKELLVHRGDCSFCTKLVHRTLFQEEKFPEGVLNEDFHLLVKMLSHIEKIVSLPEQAYHVFYRIGSNTRKENKEEFSRVYGDGINNADMVYEIVCKEYPELQKIALRFGVFQRLEYLLHIPIAQMTSENKQYKACVRWIRRKWFSGMCNPVLTKKNKIYQSIFAIMPKGIRILHKKWRIDK